MLFGLISCGNGVFSDSIPDQKILVTVWRSMLAAFKDNFHAQASRKTRKYKAAMRGKRG
jgi:hypothetical protein